MTAPIPLPDFPAPPRPIPLWLLMGGMSPEHEVSLSSALTALTQFASDRYRVRPVCIRRDGCWCLAPEAWPAPLDEAQCEHVRGIVTAADPKWPCLSPAAALAEAERDPPALALILMHGPQGEDGRIQGLLEGIGLNYTGSGVVASALAMDKRHCQRLLRSLGLPIPDFAVIERGRWEQGAEAVEREVLGAIGIPCVVKPSAAGSSVGISIVRDRQGWRRAVAEAFVHDPEVVLCEHLVAGPEVTCGVLDIPRGGGAEAVALAVTEICPREGEFFDYHCKYTPGASDEITPARLSPTLAAEVQRLALAVHRAVGARGFSRVDLMIEDDQPLILEINTIPGMTPTSLLPQGAAAVGIDFATLLTIIVEGARSSPIRHPPSHREE